MSRDRTLMHDLATLQEQRGYGIELSCVLQIQEARSAIHHLTEDQAKNWKKESEPAAQTGHLYHMEA